MSLARVGLAKGVKGPIPLARKIDGGCQTRLYLGESYILLVNLLFLAGLTVIWRKHIRKEGTYSN